MQTFSGVAIGGPLNGKILANTHTVYFVPVYAPVSIGYLSGAGDIEPMPAARAYEYRHFKIGNAGFWHNGDIGSLADELAKRATTANVVELVATTNVVDHMSTVTGMDRVIKSEICHMLVQQLATAGLVYIGRDDPKNTPYGEVRYRGSIRVVPVK